MTLQLSTNSIDAGIVSGRAEFAFTLTNTSGSPVTLTEVTLPKNNEGLVLSGLQPPQVIGAGQSLDYTAVVKRTGNEFFSGAWTFSTDSNSATLTISGERLLVWPFEINWARPVTITHSFKTDIYVSRSGKESRIARRHQPRRLIKSSLLIRGDQRQDFKSIAMGNLANPVFQPDPTRSTPLTGTASGTSVPIASGTPWAVAGAYVQVGNEVGRIASVSGGTVTLESALVSSHSAGTDVRPGFRGLLLNGIPANLLSDKVGTSVLTISETPGISDPEDYGSASATFDSVEVFPLPVNWSRSPDEDFDWPLDITDIGFGPIDTWRPVNFSSSERQFEVLLQSGQDQTLFAFFDRMRGRQGEFYCATGTDDIQLRPGLENPSTGYIRAKGQELYERLRDDTVLRAIEAVHPSGVERRTITSFSTISDGNGNDTLIQLDSDPVSDASTWTRISWLPLCRFGSDDLSVVYLTNSVARARVAVKSIEVAE